MKFHLERLDGRNFVTGYGPGYVSVNGTRHDRALLLLPDHLSDWNIATFDALDEAAFAELAQLPIEVLLLGTGTALQFPHPRLTQPLRDAHIGLEVMDTAAACRTYNILLGEDRKVGAALLIAAATPGG
jgi:uncharacterized protein